MTTNFRELEQVNFKLTSALTWGVKKDKYGGYSIPVVVNDEIAEKIGELVQEHKTKNPLYGRTLYLKSKNLSEKHMSELYNKGRTSIEVHFAVKGVYTKNDTSYLTFNTKILRKIEKPESDDSCLED